MGTLCAAALAYPRAELPFIAEWLDYHLALGVGHVFLGIHLNEEFRPPGFLMPAKRPYPAMYRLEGTEGDVLADFLDRIAPFRNRVTTLLFRRDDWRLRTQNGAQLALYRHARDRARDHFRWIAIHDIDEFLVPTTSHDLPSALERIDDGISAVVMRQVICEARWNGDFTPSDTPVLSRHRRLSRIIPGTHGQKTISRLAKTRHLYIHHSMVEGETLRNESILLYHFRGFPKHTEIDIGHHLPVDTDEFDLTDDLPQRLHDAAKRRHDKETPLSGPVALPSIKPIPVVCINLPRAVERRREMTKRWQGMPGISLSFFEATDRRDLDNGTLTPPPHRETPWGFKRRLSSGESACLMSRLEVLSLHLDSIGPEGIILMEDDALPAPDTPFIPGSISAARSEAPEAEFLLLFAPSNHHLTTRQGKHVAIAGDPHPYGAYMVWFSKRGAERYLEEMGSHSAPADHWLPFCREGIVGIIKPPISVHDGRDTYIGNEFRGPAAHREFKE